MIQKKNRGQRVWRVYISCCVKVMVRNKTMYRIFYGNLAFRHFERLSPKSIAGFEFIDIINPYIISWFKSIFIVWSRHTYSDWHTIPFYHKYRYSISILDIHIYVDHIHHTLIINTHHLIRSARVIKTHLLYFKPHSIRGAGFLFRDNFRSPLQYIRIYEDCLASRHTYIIMSSTSLYKLHAARVCNSRRRRLCFFTLCAGYVARHQHQLPSFLGM